MLHLSRSLICQPIVMNSASTFTWFTWCSDRSSSFLYYKVCLLELFGVLGHVLWEKDPIDLFVQLSCVIHFCELCLYILLWSPMIHRFFLGGGGSVHIKAESQDPSSSWRSLIPVIKVNISTVSTAMSQHSFAINVHLGQSVGQITVWSIGWL